MPDTTLAAENGVFGVYTDNTPTSNELALGLDPELFVFGETFEEATEDPFEGDNVLAFKKTPDQKWFESGIASLFGKNMSTYVESGFLKFQIKIPADIPFIIGLNDHYGNAKDIQFPAGETKYGLVRT